MPDAFISEPIAVTGGEFDTAGMARGEPGVPLRFRWRKREYAVAAVLETWKGHGACRNGSGERYVRRHYFRVRTTDDEIVRIYFQRSVGRGRMPKARWWLHSAEPRTATKIIPFPTGASSVA
jgi:phosphoribosylglycinamide formyltransferase-1